MSRGSHRRNYPLAFSIPPFWHDEEASQNQMDTSTTGYSGLRAALERGCCTSRRKSGASQLLRGLARLGREAS